MRRITALFSALTLIAICSPAQALTDIGAGARGIYWFPDLSASARTTTAGVPGTKFDVKDDLGVGDEDFLSGEAFVRFGRVTLRLGYTPVRFDGNKTLTRTIVFSNQVFNISDDVISRLDVTMVDGEVQVDLFRPDLVAARFSLGAIGKVRYVDGEVELATSATRESRDFKAPIPMVGVTASAGFLGDLLQADGRFTGMAYSGNHLYEAEAYVSVVPFPFLRLQGGYRFIDLKVDEDDIVADLELKGPYVGVQVSY